MPFTALIVEDNPDHVFLIRNLLEEQEDVREVKVFSDAETAIGCLLNSLRIAKADTSNFLLLDLKLPQMSGVEMLSRIRTEPAIMDLPVFILTSSDRVEERRRCKELGALDYFLKPLTEESVRKILQTLGSIW